MASFTYDPQTAALTIEPRVRTASFGDGYEQRVGDGINNSPRKWELSWTKQVAEADLILAFFAARGGYEAFDWTDPDGVAGKFVCRKWAHQLVGRQAKTISATFEQVFGV